MPDGDRKEDSNGDSKEDSIEQAMEQVMEQVWNKYGASNRASNSERNTEGKKSDNTRYRDFEHCQFQHSHLDLGKIEAIIFNRSTHHIINIFTIFAAS